MQIYANKSPNASQQVKEHARHNSVFSAFKLSSQIHMQPYMYAANEFEFEQMTAIQPTLGHTARITTTLPSECMWMPLYLCLAIKGQQRQSVDATRSIGAHFTSQRA